jgi:ABC-type multidrug transport system fused ATPase/permease subunit
MVAWCHFHCDRGGCGALWRLRSYARPYRAQMLTMLAAALLGVAAGSFIPLVTKGIVDGPPAELVAAASGRYAGLHRSWRQSLA